MSLTHVENKYILEASHLLTVFLRSIKTGILILKTVVIKTRKINQTKSLKYKVQMLICFKGRMLPCSKR